MRRIAICSVALAAALVVPAQGKSPKPKPHPPKSQGTGKSCAKKPTVNKGFTVRGTLDDLVTLNVNETSVAITVTGANRHARVSGELTDTNLTKPGVQVAYTVNSSRVRLTGYETGETPAAGDKVRIVGKIAVTRKKCATAGASLGDRYLKVDVRKVKIIDAD